MPMLMLEEDCQEGCYLGWATAQSQLGLVLIACLTVPPTLCRHGCLAVSASLVASESACAWHPTGSAPVRRIAPLLSRRLPWHAAVGHPFSPCRLRSPTIGSGLGFDFSLASCAGGGAYPRIEATENPKVRNRRLQKKFNGTATKPRLSVFCSDRQLYAVLADDHSKKVLFYGSTLQRSICGDPPCTTVEAARRVGEELVRACEELGISEVSYDRNGFARGDKMVAFEGPVSQHGFLPR